LAVGDSSGLKPLPGYLWAEQIRDVDRKDACEGGGYLEAVRVHGEVTGSCFQIPATVSPVNSKKESFRGVCHAASQGVPDIEEFLTECVRGSICCDRDI